MDKRFDKAKDTVDPSGVKRRMRVCAAVRLALAALLAAFGFALPTLLRGKQAWIESHYANTVYPVIARSISFVTSAVPFSIAELLIYALALCVPIGLIVRIVRVRKGRAAWEGLARWASSLLLTASALLVLFYATWGLLYFRESLSARMDLPVAARSTEELASFVEETAQKARALRETLVEDENGVFSPASDRQTLQNELIPAAYETLAEQTDWICLPPTRAKPVLWSRALSAQAIAGIYIGLTAEPNVNVDQPPLLIAQGTAHETAHYLGLASENEAEFLAYLACIGSNSAEVRYSGYAYALMVAGNALYRADAERYAALCETYGDAIWRDFADYDAYWKQFDAKAQAAADHRNDAYLKHNGQESGVKSYGESVDLMLAYREKTGA